MGVEGGIYNNEVMVNFVVINLVVWSISLHHEQFVFR